MHLDLDTVAKKAIEIARGAVPGLVELIYQPHCVICENAEDNLHLCLDCADDIVYIDRPYCRKCGRPSERFYCTSCHHRNYSFAESCSVALFSGSLREAIHAMKYDKVRVMCYELAQMMVDNFHKTGFLKLTDVVVPVPVHEGRLNERGYNHSEEMAKHFAKQFGLTVATERIAKTRETPDQVGLGYAERIGNLNGAFKVSRKYFRGKRVLVIDDVFTTGSTLDEIARTLRKAGARSVRGYTLTRSVLS